MSKPTPLQLETEPDSCREINSFYFILLEYFLCLKNNLKKNISF